ncbi:DUF6980 family protein [Hymenobacter glacialis]|uniref:DUF6980 family protein n=1 Tax=Hymenobacter glacialis TaxID=1908236 RepID=UPI0009F54089
MPSSSNPTYCCEQMVSQVTHSCETHPDPFHCPDTLVHQSVNNGTYGLIIHDGGSSFISISFCPWCGSKLPLISDAN